ncbi:MAG: type II toxin-antitoxin system prevent-host-death family antitoxin [Caldilineaceae bacterium]
MELTRVTASEFQKAFGAMSDTALKNPVTITKQGRDHLVVLSADEYQRLKRCDRQAFRLGELPQEWVNTITDSRMNPSHDHLNALLED